MIPLSLYSAWRHWDNLSTNTWKAVRVILQWRLGELGMCWWCWSYLRCSVEAEQRERDGGDSRWNVNYQPFLPDEKQTWHCSKAFCDFSILHITANQIFRVRKPALHAGKDDFAHLGKNIEPNQNLRQPTEKLYSKTCCSTAVCKLHYRLHSFGLK